MKSHVANEVTRFDSGTSEIKISFAMFGDLKGQTVCRFVLPSVSAPQGAHQFYALRLTSKYFAQLVMKLINETIFENMAGG